MDLQPEALRSLGAQNAGSLCVASQQCEQGQHHKRGPCFARTEVGVGGAGTLPRGCLLFLFVALDRGHRRGEGRPSQRAADFAPHGSGLLETKRAVGSSA